MFLNAYFSRISYFDTAVFVSTFSEKMSTLALRAGHFHQNEQLLTKQDVDVTVIQ